MLLCSATLFLSLARGRFDFAGGKDGEINVELFRDVFGKKTPRHLFGVVSRIIILI